MKRREEFEVGIELRGPSEGAPLRGDAARLESALSGILRAVLREFPPPTTVVVIAERGLLADAYNASGTAFDEKRGGLGLAVPLARRIVERHGGSVFSPEGQGRSIAIGRLPLWDQGSGVGDRGLGVGDQGSGVGNQGSGVRNQGSGVRDQGSGIRDKGVRISATPKGTRGGKA